MSDLRKQEIREIYKHVLPDIEAMGTKNNIDNWMRYNLVVETLEQYKRDIPDILGIHVNTWNTYRNGKIPVPFYVIKKLCILFSKHGCLPSDLMFTPTEKELFEQYASATK